MTLFRTSMAVAAIAASATAANAQYTLTVLHFNDPESQILHAGTPGTEIGGENGVTIPSDSASDLYNYGGAPRFVTLLNQLRTSATTDGVITISAGDNFLVGVELDASNPQKNAANTAGVNYDALWFAYAQVDVSTIGNHEWDAGPAFYQDWMEETYAGMNTVIPAANTQFVSANLDLSARSYLDSHVSPYVIVEKGGEQIGVIGGTTPLLPSISSPDDVTLIDADSDGDSDLDDLALLVQEQVTALQNQGVNKIILVTHLQNIRNEQELVTKIRGVDLVIGGGGNELLSNEGNTTIPGEKILDAYPLLEDSQGNAVTDLDGKNVPVVVASGDMRYIGEIVLTFDDAGNVTSYNGNPVVVTAMGENAPAPNATIEQYVWQPVYDYVQLLNNTVVANSTTPLDGRRAMVRNVETNLGNLIADAILWAGETQAAYLQVPAPDVAIQNGGGIRNDSVLPAGELSMGTLNSVLPFTNYVAIVPQVPPAQFKEIVENMVAYAGETQGRFGQIAGFTYVYDINGQAQELDEDGNVVTPGTRVQRIVLNDGTVVVQDGQVVQGAPAINVATIDFLAKGGDSYPFRGLTYVSTPVLYQDALTGYVENVLGGDIVPAEYPEGGEGRILRQDLALGGQPVYEGWSYSPWFGWYLNSYYPTVWSDDLQEWLWIWSGSTAAETWAYSYEDAGWIYLGEYYPWVWHQNGGWTWTILPEAN